MRPFLQKKEAVAYLALCVLIACHRARKRFRASYVRDINLNRETEGEFHTLVRDLRRADPQRHFNYLRMTRSVFDILLSKLGNRLHHANTHRQPVGPEERLALTLRILASGCSQHDIATRYRLGKATVTKIFTETVDTIWKGLKDDHVPVPFKATWERNAKNFEEKWNFLNCCGATDGKHILIKCPAKSGSLSYNCEKNYSIVLMAIVDANYRFTAMDVGALGRQIGGGTFAAWSVGRVITNDTVNLPEPRVLPGQSEPVPYVFVADAPFPLKNNLMKPFGSKPSSKIK